MLVLTRKVGEKILIGDDITITVVDLGKSRLKLGIEAPAGHRILRSELIAEDQRPSTGRQYRRGRRTGRERAEAAVAEPVDGQDGGGHRRLSASGEPMPGCHPNVQAPPFLLGIEVVSSNDHAAWPGPARSPVEPSLTRAGSRPRGFEATHSRRIPP